MRTNEIMVPVLVLDKGRALKFRDMQPLAWEHLTVDRDYKLWESIAVPDLRTADFKVYEDGRELEIQSVTPEGKDWGQFIGDNFGRSWQAIGVAGGTWSIPDVVPLWKDVRRSDSQAMLVKLPPLPWYMIAYARPHSQAGSCHRITVKVDRSDSLIYSRSGYCNAPDSAADALAGTKLGVRLGADVVSKKKSKLRLRVRAVPVFTSTGASRIRLFVEAKLDAVSTDCSSLKKGSAVVGLIYSADRTLAKRFSDGLFYAPRENSLYWDTEWFAPTRWPGRIGCADVFYEPTGYQTQLELRPGAYHLKLGFWNGQKFGRAELPLTVDRYDPMKLAIGGLILLRESRRSGSNWKVLRTTLADRYPPLVANGVAITPAANTRFRSHDPLHFYVQVYEPQKTGAHRPAVLLRLRILDAKTARIVDQPRPASAAKYATPGNPVIPIESSIDIRSLAKGCYELQAQATDSTGATTPWQSAQFAIVK